MKELKDEHGYWDGYIDDDGNVHDKIGYVKGRISDDGSVTDNNGYYQGRVDKDGTMYDKIGYYAGHMTADGHRTDKIGYQVSWDLDRSDRAATPSKSSSYDNSSGSGYERGYSGHSGSAPLTSDILSAMNLRIGALGWMAFLAYAAIAVYSGFDLYTQDPGYSTELSKVVFNTSLYSAIYVVPAAILVFFKGSVFRMWMIVVICIVSSIGLFYVGSDIVGDYPIYNTLYLFPLLAIVVCACAEGKG